MSAREARETIELFASGCVRGAFFKGGCKELSDDAAVSCCCSEV